MGLLKKRFKELLVMPRKPSGLLLTALAKGYRFNK
jgi:hypothetical protein